MEKQIKKMNILEREIKNRIVLMKQGLDKLRALKVSFEQQNTTSIYK